MTDIQRRYENVWYFMRNYGTLNWNTEQEFRDEFNGIYEHWYKEEYPWGE